jgi:nicotinic acid mononucleotide adenylyltransferase
MADLEWHRGPARGNCVRSLAVVLGSFDPPHRGHDWVLRQLLGRFDAAALLIPVTHFHKGVVYPANATLMQRLTMLEQAYGRGPQPVYLGLARQGLYLKLAEAMAEAFPDAKVGFGMGDDSHARLLDSAAYFASLGLGWTRADALALQRLASCCVVFGRHGKQPGAVQEPAWVRQISSTGVRQAVFALRSRGVPRAQWSEQLADWLLPEVESLVEQFELYR